MNYLQIFFLSILFLCTFSVNHGFAQQSTDEFTSDNDLEKYTKQIENELLQLQIENLKNEQDSSKFSWFAILIALISAAGVISSLILNAWEIRKGNDKKYVKFLLDFSNDLDIQEEKSKNCKNTEELVSWIFIHFNKLNQLALLHEKHKISDEIFDFYGHYIGFAYKALVRLDKDGKEFGKSKRKFSKKYWEYLCNIGSNEKIKKPDCDAAWLTDLDNFSNNEKT